MIVRYEFLEPQFVDFEVKCPACGDPIDYCGGHGEIGDPIGAEILSYHDQGDHFQCDPSVCEKDPSELRASRRLDF
jgi:hypothetical protein